MDDMITLSWNQNSEIENPKNHAYETVDRLRTLLSEGATIQEDLRRPGFFEVHDEETVFYAYASPISGKIYLVATWLREPVPVSV